MSSSAINSPEIDPRGKSPKVKTRAVKDAAQASVIIQSLKTANTDRNRKNARIMAKYNAERPYDPAKLEQEGLLWKSNFSTQPLPMLIDRVAPRFVQAAESVRYLTSSALPESFPDAAKKTEVFRSEITKTIRSRPEWSDFVEGLAQENALFGYAAAGWTNEFDWFPKLFRQDQFFVPSGTKQDSRNAQVVVFVEPFLVHELFDIVRDKEAAIAAGWNWENVIECLNKALPQSRQSQYSDSERVYQDLAREANTGAAYEGANTIVIDHLFAFEANGKITHWALDAASKREVFQRDDQFDTMAEVASFFAFQRANGTMHGSKGIGRIVYAMAGIIDRARNEVVDRLQLSGKLVLQGDPKAIKKFKMSIVGNAVCIDSAFTISQRSIEPNVTAFFDLDSYLSALLDQLAGNTSPRHLQGERVTAKQVDFFAAREEEAKDIAISRFLKQLAALVSVMQRKMCSPQVQDEDAREMQKRLLRLMSKEELQDLAEQPSATVVKDLTDLERQMIILVAAENRGNPLYNQRELERRKLTAQVGPDFADAVLLAENDPTEAAEQTRMQRLEIVVMEQTAQPVEVSPRDNHRVHLDFLKPAIEAGLQAVADDPTRQDDLEAFIAHAKQHISYGSQGQQSNFTADAAFLAEVETRLAALQAHDEAVAQAVDSGMDPEAAMAMGAQAAMPQPV